MDSVLKTDRREVSGKARKKGHRCLGIDCNKILTNGEWFCHNCKKIKNSVRVSGAELKFVPGISRRAVKIYENQGEQI